MFSSGREQGGAKMVKAVDGLPFSPSLSPCSAHYASPPPRNSYNRTTQHFLQAHFQNLFSGSSQVSRLHDLERFKSGGKAHVDMSSACVVWLDEKFRERIIILGLRIGQEDRNWGNGIRAARFNRFFKELEGAQENESDVKDLGSSHSKIDG